MKPEVAIAFAVISSVLGDPVLLPYHHSFDVAPYSVAYTFSAARDSSHGGNDAFMPLNSVDFDCVYASTISTDAPHEMYNLDANYHTDAIVFESIAPSRDTPWDAWFEFEYLCGYCLMMSRPNPFGYRHRAMKSIVYDSYPIIASKSAYSVGNIYGFMEVFADNNGGLWCDSTAFIHTIAQASSPPERASRPSTGANDFKTYLSRDGFNRHITDQEGGSNHIHTYTIPHQTQSIIRRTSDDYIVIYAVMVLAVWLMMIRLSLIQLFLSTWLFVAVTNVRIFIAALIAIRFRGNSALSISTGGGHTCALQTITSPGFNGLKCFGWNYYGQLGYEHTNNIGDGANEMGVFLPNIDTGIDSSDIIQSIATGYYHTCILTSTGKVKCFGLNDSGQLGLGNTDDKGGASNTMGTNLPFIDFGEAWFAIQIAAGLHHTCALLNNGTTPNVMKCFGRNDYGGLGYGNTSDRGDGANEMGDDLPLIDLGTGFDPTQITAGYYMTCALSRSNKVKCFGRNDYGQLGMGDTVNRGDSAGQMGDSLPFVDLGTGFTPIQIEAGLYHVCALSDSGDVKCWGQGDFGQLGSGHNRNIGNEMNEMGDALPIVELGSNLIAKQITAGFYHTCALFTVGNIKCCGKGRYGQLGYQNEDNLGDSSGEMSDSLPFVDLGSIGYDGAITEVQAGAWHTCATFSSDELKCWGWNFYGQLGQEHSNNIGNDTDEMSDYLPIVDLGFQSSNPTSTPTEIPTSQPSNPSSAPTSPTYIPTSPTYNPSNPSTSPTSPTDIPTTIPTYNPSKPSISPTNIPTDIPTSPTYNPSNPSTSPTSPTDIPTTIPTYNPSKPSISPTNIPTDIPTSPTYNPSNPSTSPTSQTDIPTDIPTYNPSTSPTNIPTDIPTYSPTYSPSKPSISPTSLTDIPTHNPSNPSVSPTSQTDIPTIHPTIDPTPQPTPYRNYECDEIPYILVVFFDIATNKEDFEDELVDILITVMTNTIKSLIVMEWSDDWCINLIKQNLIPYSERHRATFDMNKAIKTDVFDNPDFRFNVFKKRFTDNLKERLSSTTLIEDATQFSMDSVTDIEDIAENTTSAKSEPFFHFTDPFMISLMILTGFALLIMNSGKIHARYIDADDFRLGPVFLFTIYVWDFYTDLLFAISLYTTYVSPDRIDYMVLFIASIVFLIGPLARNFYDLLQFEDVWRAHPILDELYKKWLHHNGQYVYLLSFLSGSTYAAINLVNSNFLGHKVFSMGLSQVDVLKFNQTRLMNVVLLENIPQVIIQICFLVLSKQLTDLSMLAIVSSTLSIFLAVLKHINLQKSMDDKNVSEVMFSFKVFHSA
eukprot:9651_1